jgi:Family of unknown function (DUF6263)
MKNLKLRIVVGLAIPSGRRDCQFLILNSKFLICFVAAMFCSVAMADSLKFKFAPGDKYSLVSDTEQRTARVVDGNERVAEKTLRLECDFDIEEVDEAGFAWGKYTYRRAAVKVKSPELNFVFDSDVNELRTPIQAMPLRMVVGEGLYLRITPQGRIEKINGMQALITTAKAKVGNFAGADKIDQAIDQQFTEPVVRRVLEDQMAVFPEPNKEGATWVRTDVLSSAEAGYPKVEQVEEANMVFERTFRLNPDKSGRDRIAVVDVNLVIKPVSAPVLSTPAPESSVRANREILGEGFGRIEIEEATGRIISSKMTQDVTERVKYVAQGPMLRPPPAPEPSTTHTVTTFQMTRREPPALDKVEGDKPARPADANEKGAPATRPS